MSKNYSTLIIIASLFVLIGVAWLAWQNSGSGNSTKLISATPVPSQGITVTPTLFETPTAEPTGSLTTSPTPKTVNPTVSISVQPTISY